MTLVFCLHFDMNSRLKKTQICYKFFSKKLYIFDRVTLQKSYVVFLISEVILKRGIIFFFKVK